MLTFSQRPELHHELKLKQTLEQRLQHQIALETRLTQLRIELIAALYDRRYTPDARCPTCEHRMTLLEILKGFNEDPLDRTTKCPKCDKRFFCQLVAHAGEVQMELAFYCPSQVRYFLRTNSYLNLLTPEEFQQNNPAYYHSAIAHFGTLCTAFKLEGLSYTFVELPEDEVVRLRIKPFLGKLTDKAVAEATGLSIAKIRGWRRSAHIAPYKKRKTKK